MPPIVVKETVQAPIDRVFEALSDIPHAAEHISGLDRVEMLTEGPVGVGTRWRETRTLFGREATEEMWITDFDPPHGYTAEARSHGTYYVTPITLREIEPGVTELTFTFDARPETLMAKIMSKVFSGMQKQVVKLLARDLADIKAHCESDPS